MLDDLRRALDAIRFELARAQLKYSPSQPRVPAGSTGSGRKTALRGISGAR